MREWWRTALGEGRVPSEDQEKVITAPHTGRQSVDAGAGTGKTATLALRALWIKGLSTRDFEPSLRALLGQAAAFSPSTISRVNKQFHDEYKIGCKRPIANKFVFLWSDGLYLGRRPR